MLNDEPYANAVLKRSERKAVEAGELHCHDCNRAANTACVEGGHRTTAILPNKEEWQIDPYSSCEIISKSNDGRAVYLEHHIATIYGDDKDHRAKRATAIIHNHAQAQLVGELVEALREESLPRNDGDCWCDDDYRKDEPHTDHCQTVRRLIDAALDRVGKRA